MKLGEKQVLTVVKIVDFGVYLGNDEERVLLPPNVTEVGSHSILSTKLVSSTSHFCTSF